MTNSGINRLPSGGNELTSIRGTIRNHYESAIFSGALAPGTRLPTTQELARTFHTTPANVHAAMATLCAAGLIERRKRLGTRVANRRRPDRIAFAVPGLAWQESAYLRGLWGAFSAAAAATGVESELLTFSTPEAGRAALTARFESSGIAAAVVLACNPEFSRPLIDAGYPVLAGRETGFGFVGYPDREVLQQVFVAFRRRGAKRVGLLSSDENPAVCDEFSAAAARQGFETRPEWLRRRPRGEAGHYDRFREWGYDEFRALWRSPERPDALYVYTDDLIPGVLLGALAEKIRIGTELRLVMFRNRELPTLCPAPADFIEISIVDLASALLRQVLRRRRGENCVPELLHPELRSNSPGNDL